VAQNVTDRTGGAEFLHSDGMVKLLVHSFTGSVDELHAAHDFCLPNVFSFLLTTLMACLNVGIYCILVTSPCQKLKVFKYINIFVVVNSRLELAYFNSEYREISCLPFK
jgi:hypothetical protein